MFFLIFLKKIKKLSFLELDIYSIIFLNLHNILISLLINPFSNSSFIIYIPNIIPPALLLSNYFFILEIDFILIFDYTFNKLFLFIP